LPHLLTPEKYKKDSHLTATSLMLVRENCQMISSTAHSTLQHIYESTDEQTDVSRRLKTADANSRDNTIWETVPDVYNAL